MTQPLIDNYRLSQMLIQRRHERSMTLADVSQETAVSVSTLSRVERLKKGDSFTPDYQTAVSLIHWLGLPISLFVEVTPEPDMTVAQHLLVVESYMRAHDGKLPSEAMPVIARILILLGNRMLENADIPTKENYA